MKWCARYVTALWLPVLLAALFVVQNQIFNSWVHLSPNPQLTILLIESFTLGILLYGPAALFGTYMRYAYLLAIALVVSVIFIAQYMYFSFYGGFLQASALKYAGQLGAERSTVFTLLTPRLLVFLLNVFAVIIAAIFYRFYRKERSHGVVLRGRGKAVVAFGVVLIAAFGYSLLFVTAENGWQKVLKPHQTLHDLNSFAYAPNVVIQKVGICNYSFGDVIGMLLRAVPVTEEDERFVEGRIMQKPPEAADKYFGSARGKDLIIVQFESLEASVIGQSIGGEEITPSLNALTKEGLYFNNYYTQVGPGNTADAEFVTLNSLYPLANTVAFIDFANNTYQALPDLLKQNGYHTFVLHGDVPTFWNRANIYPSLGYEVAISKDDFIPHETNFETLSDDDFLAQSVEKMRTFPHPFMTTLITLSSHSPFIIPKEFQTLPIPPDSTLSDTQKNYLESVHYADNALGKFIADLKASGLYDNAVIAIYGDHGSQTGISDRMGTTTTQGIASLRPSQVPLLLIMPKDSPIARKTVAVPGSHLDLYPTIADLLGVTPPSNVFGKDLLGTKSPVVTRRDPYTQIITAILSTTLAYEGAESGIFAEGKCVTIPGNAALPIEECKNMYDDQSSNIRASDLIVRGDLIPELSLRE